MSRIAKLRDEILMIFFAVVMCSIYKVWKEYDPQNPYIQLALAIVLAISVFFMFYYMRKIWNGKAKSAIGKRLKRLATRAFGLIMRFAAKLSFFKRGANVLGGKTTVSFDFSGFKAKKKRQEKFIPPKWKDMDSARKKLGFLYYKLITHKITKGMRALPCDTPTELQRRSSNSENEEKLFDMYIGARYNENAVLSEQEILKLKDELFD